MQDNLSLIFLKGKYPKNLSGETIFNNHNIKLSFIANENCYSKCEMKIQHNQNQNLRNNGVNIPKFNCPYLDKRYFYSEDDVKKVMEKYPIEIIKLCDRAFDDEKLIIHLRKWVK